MERCNSLQLVHLASHHLLFTLTSKDVIWCVGELTSTECVAKCASETSISLQSSTGNGVAQCSSDLQEPDMILAGTVMSGSMLRSPTGAPIQGIWYETDLPLSSTEKICDPSPDLCHNKRTTLPPDTNGCEEEEHGET